MELSDLLAQSRSKRLSISISDWIGQNSRLVEELMTWCYDESSDYKEMACWVMADILDRKPYLLKPHLETILNACKKEGYSDTVYRNSFRVLARIYVPLELEERLIDVAFTYFENKKNAIAIRMFCTIILGEHLDLSLIHI